MRYRAQIPTRYRRDIEAASVGLRRYRLSMTFRRYPGDKGPRDWLRSFAMVTKAMLINHNELRTAGMPSFLTDHRAQALLILLKNIHEHISNTGRQRCEDTGDTRDLLNRAREELRRSWPSTKER